MEFFLISLGFGFILICLVPVIMSLGIFRCCLHIALSKDKKIEVTPSQENFNSNPKDKD